MNSLARITSVSVSAWVVLSLSVFLCSTSFAGPGTVAEAITKGIQIAERAARQKVILEAITSVFHHGKATAKAEKILADATLFFDPWSSKARRQFIAKEMKIDPVLRALGDGPIEEMAARLVEGHAPATVVQEALFKAYSVRLQKESLVFTAESTLWTDKEPTELIELLKNKGMKAERFDEPGIRGLKIIVEEPGQLEFMTEELAKRDGRVSLTAHPPSPHAQKAQAAASARKDKLQAQADALSGGLGTVEESPSAAKAANPPRAPTNNPPTEPLPARRRAAVGAPAK